MREFKELKAARHWDDDRIIFFYDEPIYFIVEDEGDLFLFLLLESELKQSEYLAFYTNQDVINDLLDNKIDLLTSATHVNPLQCLFVIYRYDETYSEVVNISDFTKHMFEAGIYLRPNELH